MKEIKIFLLFILISLSILSCLISKMGRESKEKLCKDVCAPARESEEWDEQGESMNYSVCMSHCTKDESWNPAD